MSQYLIRAVLCSFGTSTLYSEWLRYLCVCGCLPSHRFDCIYFLNFFIHELSRYDASHHAMIPPTTYSRMYILATAVVRYWDFSDEVSRNGGNTSCIYLCSIHLQIVLLV